jgi:hypothetical protein
LSFGKTWQKLGKVLGEKMPCWVSCRSQRLRQTPFATLGRVALHSRKLHKASKTEETLAMFEMACRQSTLSIKLDLREEINS